MHVLAEKTEPLEPETEDDSPADEQTPEEAELYGIPLLGFRNHKTTCSNTQDEGGEDETAAGPKKDGSVA